MSILNLNDNELVSIYCNGNENALEVLLNRHKRKLFSSIYIVVKDNELANDLFQETFFKIIVTLKKGQYNEEGKFLPWVLRIARNLIIDHFRKIKKMPPVPIYTNDKGEEICIFSNISGNNTADELIGENNLLKTNLRKAIKELPFDQKEVVIMRMYYDLSFKEIAEITNVSINTSLGRMRYALMNLKKILTEKKLELI